MVWIIAAVFCAIWGLATAYAEKEAQARAPVTAAPVWPEIISDYEWELHQRTFAQMEKDGLL